MDEYLTVSEAAARIGITARALLSRIERGEVRAERLGRRLWAIPRHEADRLVAGGKLRPGPKARRRQSVNEPASPQTTE
jgi:excisionase family DNA binding protein